MTTAQQRRALGAYGERIAARHLVENGGMTVLDRNWQCAAGELDLVLRDGGDVTGRVRRADDAEDGGVLLDVDGAERDLAYADVARGLVQVEFSRTADDDEATS